LVGGLGGAIGHRSYDTTLVGRGEAADMQLSLVVCEDSHVPMEILDEMYILYTCIVGRSLRGKDR
jgi:hypothetical protein